ncbi:sigma-54-dependent transcriptional regulator [Microbacter margulisiae]|uniref:Two-component system response regulator HydG n=1 Tax=Microbacter margulisiae TaxID=1350067 RepID=A0A7W5DRW4_9PORP|nr:sigma-54 dependent transcriptional regulator [Microbacter margulisiae]MBB3187945.1 two-component system response regulator HydG [Microbacter margulisiae]
MKQTILIIEDDTTFGTMLQRWCLRIGFEAELCSDISSAEVTLSHKKVHLVLSDLRLPDGDGIMLLHWMRDRKMNIPVIVMTSYAEIQSAVAAIKLGAEDFLEKPMNPSILKDKIEQALSVKPASTKISGPIVNNMILGKSPEAQQMYDHILKVAPTRMSVLIVGESGTGKEYAARMIHENSPRRNKPFIAVDCGSLSRELAPSELFGHLKGSFTSAIEDKSGVFVQADQGTVFLDEVGNLSYDVQVQLLRTLQEQKVRPVGSVKDIKVDVRILAATNEDLGTAIAEGRFREDLYHRLNEFSLFIPPIRDRKGDIPIFANEFLRQANEELEKSVKGFLPDAMALLERHHWSGNLRELRNTVRRLVLFASNDMIAPSDIPAFAPSSSVSENLALQPDNEREQIENALRKARGNKTLAATLLKIDRKTLYNKMHLYDIKF